MNQLIKNAINKHKEALELLIHQKSKVSKIANIFIKTLEENGKILIAGNGGSAADAQHIAAELVGRFKKNRNALAAIALTTDTSILTAVGNDFGFDDIFLRQVQALAKQNDLLFVISTSGNSKNIIKAVEYARENKIKTVGFLGKNGGELLSKVDISLTIPIDDTPAIQQMHSLAEHIICEIVEKRFS